VNKTKRTKETKNPGEVRYVDSYSIMTTSITPDQEGNKEDLEEVKQQPEDEVEVPKKRKCHLRSLPLRRKKK
jgi:hypothetical protein